MTTNGYKWHYAQNQFANATKNNFKLMNLLSADHSNKIAAEAQTGEQLFVDMYNAFKPLRQEYNKNYADWLVAKGMHKAQTMRLMIAFDDMYTKQIPKWDAQIQAVFIERSPEYVEIFPGGRTAFRNGAYDIRISRFYSFFLAVSKHEELETTAKEVEEYYNTINEIREIQQAYEGGVKKASSVLEKSRKKTAKLMYQDLAKLMDYFVDDTEEIERFFNLEYISSKPPIADDEPVIVAEGKVEPETKLTIDALTAKFNADTELVVHNTGDTVIELYTTKLPSDPVPGQTTTVGPDKLIVVSCGELGAEENLYLIVYNPSVEKTASYSIGVNHYGINQEQIK